MSELVNLRKGKSIPLPIIIGRHSHFPSETFVEKGGIPITDSGGNFLHCHLGNTEKLTGFFYTDADQIVPKRNAAFASEDHADVGDAEVHFFADIRQ